MSNPEDIPSGPEEDLLPDQVAAFVHAVYNLLPDTEIRVRAEDVIDDEEPAIEETAEAAFVLFVDGHQTFIHLDRINSSIGLHEVSAEKVTFEPNPQKAGTLTTKDTYTVDFPSMQPSFIHTVKPLTGRKKSERSAPPSEEDIENTEADIRNMLANITLASDMGLYRFTQGHYEEIMKLLSQCGPHNQVPLK